MSPHPDQREFCSQSIWLTASPQIPPRERSADSSMVNTVGLVSSLYRLICAPFHMFFPCLVECIRFCLIIPQIDCRGSSFLKLDLSKLLEKFNLLHCIVNLDSESVTKTMFLIRLPILQSLLRLICYDPIYSYNLTVFQQSLSVLLCRWDTLGVANLFGEEISLRFIDLNVFLCQLLLLQDSLRSLLICNFMGSAGLTEICWSGLFVSMEELNFASLRVRGEGHIFLATGEFPHRDWVHDGRIGWEQFRMGRVFRRR